MTPDVIRKFSSYPEDIKKPLMKIRKMILDVAQEDCNSDITETLKWGEPSFIIKGGSTVRIDWKAKAPDQYAVYFNCQTNLVETFREIYKDVFIFEGNRAIVFQKNDKIPERELKHCISMALNYHKNK